MLNLTMEYASGAYEPVGQADNEEEALEMLAAHYAAFARRADGDFAEQGRIWVRGEGGRWITGRRVTTTEMKG